MPATPSSDPFTDIFGDPNASSSGTATPSTSGDAMCQDLFCFDIFDCAIFHLEEAGVCNFTDCVNFVCVQ